MAQWLASERYGNGTDGAYAPETGTDDPIDSSCSGTAEATELSATNASFEANQIILIHQGRGTGVGQWELNVIDSYTAGTITTKYALAYTYTDSGASQAQVLVLKQYSSALIDIGVTLTAKAWDGNVGGIIAFMCNGTTTITETIIGSAKGFLKGLGTTDANLDGYTGEGTTGASVRQNTANGTGGGGAQNGGGAGGNGSGGGGGYATVGEAGVHGYSDNGAGGESGGIANLSTLIFGGAGGAGGGGSSGAGKDGGTSGSIVMIFSREVSITGSIAVNGENGVNEQYLGGEDYLCAGGGGSGGSVLIKGDEITLGTSLIESLKGTGGLTSGGGSNSGHGGDGSNGRIAVYYGTSYTGESNPAATFVQDNDLKEQQSGAPIYI